MLRPGEVKRPKAAAPGLRIFSAHLTNRAQQMGGQMIFGAAVQGLLHLDGDVADVILVVQ